MSHLGRDVHIYDATIEHARELAPVMRAADKREVWASSRSAPLEALERSLELSEHTFAGYVGDEIVCMFGCASQSILGGVGSPWLLGSDRLETHFRPFLRGNRIYIEHLKKRYMLLFNYVDAQNVVSISWLRWLGFDILPTEPYGPFGLPFHRFEMRSECANQ